MAKVLGVHEIELKAGTAPEEFERFINEEFLQMPSYPGVRYTVLKGVRGRRVDQYLLVFEFESLETFQRMTPREHEFEEAYQAFVSSPPVKAVLERWQQLATSVSPDYTDYVELGTIA